MAQNNGFKDSVLLVNPELIGILNRTRPAGAVQNYALRVNWGTTDRLRGILGSYYAAVPDAAPTNLVNLGPGSADLGNAAIANQVQSIPITLTQIPVNDGVIKYLIELDKEAWNSLSFEESSRDFLRQVIEVEGEHEGDPNWEYFLKSGVPSEILDPDGNLQDIPAVFDTTDNFQDLASFYYRASDDPAIRARSGLTVKVEPVYNYYADTTPPYEQISLKASEPMLTNFYCLESEIRNTGSTLNSRDYFNQITLKSKLQEVNIDGDAQPDPWFQEVAGPSVGFTESKTVQFYTLYSKGLNIINQNNGIGVLKGAFEENYKNIVILNSDLNAMNSLAIRDDETTGLSNLTFYNKVTIGVDQDGVSDPADMLDGASFLSHLISDPDFENSSSFMDILQLYIIQNILDDRGTGMPFHSRQITKKSAEDPTTATMALQSAPAALYFDLDTFLQEIAANSGRIQEIVDRINTNVTTNDSFILIRDYNNPSGITAASTSATDEFLLLNEDDRVNYPVRSFDKILQNKPCYSEPIMYRIDKRLINPGGNVSEPVQSFFIGKSFEGKEINYIDSQVKYGVRYQYDIKQIRMVFGNRYSYKDLKIFFAAVAGYGRAVGNALGYYRPPDPEVRLDDYISQGVQEYTSVDSDPMESQVTIDGTGDEISALTSYYIFRPSNFNDFVGGSNQTVYDQLFSTGTGYVHAHEIMPNSSPTDREILDSIQISIKEGFGFSGNATGGAVSGILNMLVPPGAMPPPDGSDIPLALQEPDVPFDDDEAQELGAGAPPGYALPGGSFQSSPTNIAPDILRDLLEGN